MGTLSCLLLLVYALAAAGAEDQYQYEGQVQFKHAHHGKHAMPRLQLLQQPAHSHPEVQEPTKTVLIKRDGAKFTKRLSLHESDGAVQLAKATQLPARHPELPGISVRQQPQVGRRQLKQAQIQRASASLDLSCTGCPAEDVRQQVTQTTTYPYSAVGELLGGLPTSKTGLQCSGSLIGRSHVVTAAHCVYDINESHQYVDSLDFKPGADGGAAPYGTLRWKTARVLSQFTSQTSYTPTAMNYDFALVTLEDEAPAATGTLGLYQPPSSGSASVSLTTAGYPGDKPSGTMWQSSCGGVNLAYAGSGPFTSVAQCSSGGCGNIMSHTCLSYDGQSGSAMWDSNHLQRAILCGKVQTNNDVDYNVGTIVDAFVYNTIAQWYNEDMGNETMPLSPVAGSNRASKPSPFATMTITTPWVLAVLGTGAGLLVCGLVSLLCATCCRSSRPSAKSVDMVAPRSGKGGKQGVSQGQFWGMSGSLPDSPHHPAGVLWDQGSHQFMVHGLASSSQEVR